MVWGGLHQSAIRKEEAEIKGESRGWNDNHNNNDSDISRAGGKKEYEYAKREVSAVQLN